MDSKKSAKSKLITGVIAGLIVAGISAGVLYLLLRKEKPSEINPPETCSSQRALENGGPPCPPPPPPPPPPPSGKNIYAILETPDPARLDIYYKCAGYDWTLFTLYKTVLCVAQDSSGALYGVSLNVDNGTAELVQWDNPTKKWVFVEKLDRPGRDLAFSKGTDVDILYLLDFNLRDIYYIASDGSYHKLDTSQIDGQILSIAGVHNGVLIAANNLWFYEFDNGNFILHKYRELETSTKVKIRLIALDADDLLIGYAADKKIYKQDGREFYSNWVETDYAMNLPDKPVLQIG